MQEQVAVVQLKNGQKKYGKLILNEVLNQLELLPLETMNHRFNKIMRASEIISYDEVCEIDFCLK